MLLGALLNGRWIFVGLLQTSPIDGAGLEMIMSIILMDQAGAMKWASGLEKWKTLRSLPMVEVQVRRALIVICILDFRLTVVFAGPQCTKI